MKTTLVRSRKRPRPARKRRQIRPERDATRPPPLRSRSPASSSRMQILSVNPLSGRRGSEGLPSSRHRRRHARCRPPPRSQTTSNQSPCSARTTRSDHRPRQRRDPAANRRAEGQKLVYTVAENKFVLSGGPPSIFDAEQGKITGVSLTFFRRDDRVLVEGEANNPVVTQTRVAR